MPAPFCYDYPRPMVTVDLVVFTLVEESLRVLLIRRKHEPFAGKWAIPGGFLEIEEAVEAGARRELREETGLEVPGAIEPIGFFATPGRDPRGRTITLAHVCVLRAGEHQIKGGDDAAEAAWVTLAETTELAFDHADILASARGWLAEGLVERKLGLGLLPEVFKRAQVRSLFQELGLSIPLADRWVRRNLREGSIKSDPHRSCRIYLADPAR